MSPTGPAPYTITLESNTKIFLRLPPIFASENKYFYLRGTRTFDFTPSSDGTRASVVMKEFQVFTAPTTINLGGPFGSQSIDIPEISLTPSNVEVNTVSGKVNLNTGRFSAEYLLSVSTGVFEVFSDLGFNETVPIVINESGTFNLTPGQETLSSRLAIKVHPRYAGIFSWADARKSVPLAKQAGGCGGTDSGSEGPCSSQVSVFGVVGKDGGTHTSKELVICPGDAVTIEWEFSKDITEANLSDGFDLETSVDNHGSRVFYPRQDRTVYTVRGRGDCKAEDYMVVTVVNRPYSAYFSGQLVDDFEFGIRPPATGLSTGLRATRIVPIQTATSFAHEPLIANLLHPDNKYLDCPGFRRSVNCRWFAQYDWSNGQQTLFTIDETNASCEHSMHEDARILPTPVPLVGSWKFIPLEYSAGQKELKGTADFFLEVTC